MMPDSSWVNRPGWYILHQPSTEVCFWWDGYRWITHPNGQPVAHPRDTQRIERVTATSTVYRASND